MEKKLSREDAWKLLTDYTKSPALQQHALAVEAVMSHFGRLSGEDEEVWGVAGLLHDLDYEQSLERLAALPEDYTVRPGHEEMTSIDEERSWIRDLLEKYPCR